MNIASRKMYVLYEDILFCNPLTDHEAPKNVLPVFYDYITNCSDSIKNLIAINIQTEFENILTQVIMGEIQQKNEFLADSMNAAYEALNQHEMAKSISQLYQRQREQVEKLLLKKMQFSREGVELKNQFAMDDTLAIINEAENNPKLMKKSATTSNINVMMMQIKRFQETIQKQAGEAKDLQKKIAELTEELSVQKLLVSDLDVTKMNLEGTLADISEKATKYEAEKLRGVLVDKIDYNKMQEQIQQLNNELMLQKQKFAKLSQSSTSVESEFVKAQNRINELNSQIAALKNQLIKIQQSNNPFVQEIEDMKFKIQNQEEEKAKLVAQCSEQENVLKFKDSTHNQQLTQLRNKVLQNYGVDLFDIDREINKLKKQQKQKLLSGETDDKKKGLIYEGSQDFKDNRQQLSNISNTSNLNSLENGKQQMPRLNAAQQQNNINDVIRNKTNFINVNTQIDDFSTISGQNIEAQAQIIRPSSEQRINSNGLHDTDTNANNGQQQVDKLLNSNIQNGQQQLLNSNTQNGQQQHDVYDSSNQRQHNVTPGYVDSYSIVDRQVHIDDLSISGAPSYQNSEQLQKFDPSYPNIDQLLQNVHDLNQIRNICTEMEKEFVDVGVQVNPRELQRNALQKKFQRPTPGDQTSKDSMYNELAQIDFQEDQNEMLTIDQLTNTNKLRRIMQKNDDIKLFMDKYVQQRNSIADVFERLYNDAALFSAQIQSVRDVHIKKLEAQNKEIDNYIDPTTTMRVSYYQKFENDLLGQLKKYVYIFKETNQEIENLKQLNISQMTSSRPQTQTFGKRNGHFSTYISHIGENTNRPKSFSIVKPIQINSQALEQTRPILPNFSKPK